MNTDSLIATGLTSLQAQAYSLLIELGEARPPEVAAKLHITRSNAYKVLDKLVELKLANKQEIDKKFSYQILNPIALTSMAADFRSQAAARELAVQQIMHDLLARYHAHSDKPDIATYTGRLEVANAYRRQINLQEDIYFIHTHTDVALMGFDTMHEVRTAPGRNGNQRQAIMFPEGRLQNGSINHENHKRSNMDVTFADFKDYDSPVEWSATKSSLLIVLYATEPHAIFITDPIVAGAFLQLFNLLQRLLQTQPTHQKLRPNL